jgi:hypothetical protein
MSEVQSIDRNTSADEAMTILERDGVVVYKNLLEDETMDQIRSEFDAYVGRAYHGEGEFWGVQDETLRCVGYQIKNVRRAMRSKSASSSCH